MGVRRGAAEVDAGGVMHSWPIPSRMPSDLCYKAGHPSCRQTAALYTNAQT